MKRLVLFLSLFCLAIPARADEVQKWDYSSITKLFNGSTRANGTKQVPVMDVGNISVPVTGPRTTTIPISWWKIGHQVTLTIGTNATIACTSAAFFASANGALPVAITPLLNSYYPLFVQDNNATLAAVGDIYINNAGYVEIDKNVASNPFTGSGNCGWYSTSITYNVP